jgi:Holliday junction resolvase
VRVTGGKAPRAKGDRQERAVAKLLQDSAFAAARTPLSGACGGRYRGDVTVPILGIDRTIECKARGGKGFAQLYEWLKNRDHDQTATAK